MDEFTRDRGEETTQEGHREGTAKEIRKPGEWVVIGAKKAFLVGRSDQQDQTQQESSDYTKARKTAPFEQCQSCCDPRLISHSSSRMSASFI